VQSMDYTAAHLFEQMHRQLAQRGGQLLFSGMPSALLNQRDFEHYLVELGVVKKGGGVMISETLDGALEWMEDRILVEFGVARSADETPLALRDFELFRAFDDAMIEKLMGCVTERTLSPGQPVFSYGNEGDEIFLVRRGSVRIMLPLEGGKWHHLATIGRGDFFGEISFLDRGARSADTEAKAQTDLFVLSRARFNTISRLDASLGVQVFARMAFTIAERLRGTDAELRMLEER
jgi:SulP family sulfate permease